ncbi:Peptidyl-prolyl cis-trans isomerase cyp8 [Tulasnella sp. 417]|nr:Peptidyl-prolyl cis-trans isomerase cyp8 [Tulasnella sp. 417]
MAESCPDLSPTLFVKPDLNREHDNTDPNGNPLKPSDLITLHYHRNSKNQLHDPVSFKTFSEHSHIVAIKTTGNVFLADSVGKLAGGRDLVSDVPFTKADIITLQNPHAAPAPAPPVPKTTATAQPAASSSSKPSTSSSSDVSVDIICDDAERSNALALQATKNQPAAEPPASSALAKARKAAAQPYNASPYSTGAAGASLTSTSLDPLTKGEMALYDEEELMYEDISRERKEKDRIKRRAYVRMVTNMGGSLNLELFCDRAPKTCYNFLMLAREGKYDDCPFHRLIPGFMIQGGDPTGTGRGGQSYWGTPFRDEYDLKGAEKHTERGVLSMANKGAATNGSQFFITFRATPHLDGKHTVFGKLVGGEEILAAMEDPFEEYKKRVANKIQKQAETLSSSKSGSSGDKAKDKVNWFGEKIGESSNSGPKSGGVGKYLKSGGPPPSTSSVIGKRNTGVADIGVGIDDKKKKRKMGFVRTPLSLVTNHQLRSLAGSNPGATTVFNTRMSRSSVKPLQRCEDVCKGGCTETNANMCSPSSSSQINTQTPALLGSSRTISTLAVDNARSTTEQTTDTERLSSKPDGASPPQATATNEKPDILAKTSSRRRRCPTGLINPGNTQPSRGGPAIHRLPLELLIKIFRGSTEADRGAGWLSQDRILKLSVVCQHWRSVVYDTPSLWSAISSYYRPARLKKTIELSKGHLLDVHLVTEPFGSTSTSVFATIRSTQCTRWRTLQGKLSVRSFATISRSTAPNLEELDLVLGEVRSGSRATAIPLVNTHIFQGPLIRLRRLKLQWTAQHFTFNWGSMMFPGLESLHLTTANQSAAPSSAELLSVLGRSNKIRDVELNLPNKSESPQQDNDEEPAADVQLRSLQRFYLMSNSSYASNVLSRLRMPPSAFIDMSINLDAQEPYPTSLIHQAVPQLVSAATQVATARKPAERPKIDLLLDHGSIVLQVGHSSFGEKKKKNELLERPLFHMRIFGPNFPGVERALDALGTVLSTSAIEPAVLLRVTFDKIADMGASACFQAVARLPRVTAIQIGVAEGSTSRDVDQFLKFSSQVQSDCVSSWPFPELEELVVCNADPNLIVDAVRLRYRGFVGGRRTSANDRRKQLEAKPLKLLTAYWKDRVAGEYESLRNPVVRVLGVNRVLWWYDSGKKGVWQ